MAVDEGPAQALRSLAKIAGVDLLDVTLRSTAAGDEIVGVDLRPAFGIDVQVGRHLVELLRQRGDELALHMLPEQPRQRPAGKQQRHHDGGQGRGQQPSVQRIVGRQRARRHASAASR